MKAVISFFAFVIILTSCTAPQLQISEDDSSIPTTKVENQNDRPNVIVIMADDLGYETVNINGGNSYRTPNMDRMALAGMRFNHCYSQPLCTPSRVKLMTGINNIRNYVSFGNLDTSQTTFGNLFDEAGYETCIIGKWQLGRDNKLPAHFGFQEHCLWQLTTGRIDSAGRDTRFSAPLLSTNGDLKQYDRDEYGPEVVSNYGLEFIERSVKENKNFLLYYPMILTHCPFSPSPDSKSWMTNDTSVNIYKGHPEYFGDMVSYADKILGRINNKLEELQIKENTLVIFTGDNGTDKPIVSYMYGREIPGAKGKSTDGGTRVPLIVQWPEKIKAREVSDELVDFSDILPTICEAANIESPTNLDGQSLLPLLKGQAYSPRQCVYNWYSRFGEMGKASVFARTQQYKLYDDGRFYNVPNDYEEQEPIPMNELNKEARQVYEMLNSVLVSNAKRRLEEIPKIPTK